MTLEKLVAKLLQMEMEKKKKKIKREERLEKKKKKNITASYEQSPQASMVLPRI